MEICQDSSRGERPARLTPAWYHCKVVDGIVKDSEASSAGRSPSGRFVLRLPPSLHARLRTEASDACVSLNELCVRKLGAVSSDLPEAIDGVIARATEEFGKDLHGVVLYGSWARGEATPRSDVDIMIVLDPRVALNIRLYSEWEAAERTSDDRPIDIHFTHLPGTQELPSGLWAEIALDGRVLYESDLTVTRVLAGVRRRIAAGELVRRTTHGQPYWVRGPIACAT